MKDQSKKFVSRRQMLKMIGTGAAGLALAACTSPAKPTEQAQPPAAPEKAAEEPAKAPASKIETGKLTVLLCCGTDQTHELQQRFNDYFDKTYPSIKTSLELPPPGQNYFEKLQTLFAAGTPPDVFDMWEGYVQPYAANGALLDCTPFIEASDWKMDDFQPAAVTATSYEGKMYSIVRDFYPGPAMFFYNKALFDKAKIEYPAFEWDWDKMRSVAQQLTQGEGQQKQYGLMFETWFVPWLHWIWSNGGDLFNADETKSAMTDEKTVQAIQFWADLINKDQVALPSAEMSAMQGAINAFKTGQVGMYLGYAWNIADMKAAKEQGLDWGCLLPPAAPGGKRSFYMHLECWAIAKPTKVPYAAWQYVYDFTMNATAEFVSYYPGIPLLKKDIGLFLTDENKSYGWDKLPNIISDPKNIRIPGAGAKFDKISQIVQAELDLVFTGEKTAKAAAETASPKVDEELARASSDAGGCNKCERTG